MPHFLLALCLLFPWRLLSTELRFLYLEVNTLPWFGVEQDNAYGLIYDIGDGIAQELSLKAKYTVTSRNRLEPLLAAGKHDAYCFYNPLWVKDPSIGIEFSLPLFYSADWVVTRSTQGHLELAQMKGFKIGTNTGYVYPWFDPHFRDNSMIRMDILSLKDKFRLLQAGKIDAFIDSALAIRHFLKDKQLAREVTAPSLIINQYAIHCALSPHGRVQAVHFNQAIERLQSRQYFEQTLLKYR